MKKFNIKGFTENDFQRREAGHEKSVYRGELAKKGGFGQFANLRGGGLGEKEGVVFLRGVDTPMHTKTKMLKDVKRKMLKSNYISNFI